MSDKPTDSSHALELGRRRGRLLVVDDEPANIRLVHQVFAGSHEVYMATSGEKALAFCDAQSPDLILLDVTMPGMDGLELCRRLKQRPGMADIPIVFITARDDLDCELACWAAGAVDFVHKPIIPVTLRNRVQAHLTLKFQADLLRCLVHVDGLTGVANRRLFDERLEQEWARCQRNQAPLSLLMIDVDHFKRYNDHYGHLAGDDCLRRVAQALQMGLRRSTDLLARYGGEEFAVLLPETDAPAALRSAEMLGEAVRALGIAHAAADGRGQVSVSLGVATLVPGRAGGADELLGAADTQLYRAKQAGRDRVCGERAAPDAGSPGS